MAVTAMASKSIPKTYKALTYKEPGKLATEVVELETPEPKAGEILVKLSVFVFSSFLFSFSHSTNRITARTREYVIPI